MIEDTRGRTCKAYMLLKLWDQGIPSNPGSLLKLIIAMYKSGFAGSYLKDFILTPLKDCFDFDCLIREYIEKLSSRDIREMFPILDVNDVLWDEELESDLSEISDTPELPTITPVHSPIIKDSIYVSYVANSRDKVYKKQVKEMIKMFKKLNHRVWCDSSDLIMTPQQRERCIKSAATILVAYNHEYKEANYSYLRNLSLPPCLAVDIPNLSQMFYYTNGAKRRIIPVIIDKCHNQPSICDLPIYLSGMPRLLFPGQKTDLVYVVQGVREFEPARVTGPIKRVKPKKIDRAELHERFSPRQ
jgi:hypothetical protein